MRCAGDGGFTSSVSGTQTIIRIQLVEVPDDASIRILDASRRNPCYLRRLCVGGVVLVGGLDERLDYPSEVVCAGGGLHN